MNDSFRIIIGLVAPFNLELQQMNIKTVLLNDKIEEEKCMVQPDSFEAKVLQHLVCKLKKSIVV